MKKLLLLLGFALVVGGCAGKNSAVHHAEIVKKEVSRLSAPSKSLSSYGNFELKEMVVDKKLSTREEKAEAIKNLENKISAKVTPLLNDWKKNGAGKSGTLYVIPELHELRIISGGARFWIGGMAGDSNIDMNLKLVDAETGEEVAKPKLSLKSGAMMGGWSVGATDRNLLGYIADISHEYLKSNYK